MAKKTRVGIIDIGSNSIRLVVFDGPKRGAFPVVNESSVCELGRGVADTGLLTDDAIGHAEGALVRLVRLAEAMKVSRLDLLATAALRDARNGPLATARLEAAAGRAVRVIDAGEEARLSALGVASGFYGARGIVGDLGGGSLELARLKDDEAVRVVSLPLGTLRLIAHDGSQKSSRARIDKALDGVGWLAKGKGRNFYAVGGVWRSLARIAMTRKNHPIDVIHGFGVSRREAVSLCDVIAGASRESLEKFQDCPRRRAEALPSAALLLSRIIERMAPKRVLFSAHGLREGWLYDLLETQERKRDPLAAACEDEGFIPRRSNRLVGLFEAWVAPLFAHGDAHITRLRRIACLLSDMAWREPPDHRARHAFYRALYLPMGGLEHDERAYLALSLALRYGAAYDNPMVVPVLGLLSSEERHDAAILGAGLRLGYAISGGAYELLGNIRLALDGGEPRLVSDEDDPILGAEPVQRRLDALKRALAGQGQPIGF